MSDFTTPPYDNPDAQLQLGGTNLQSEVRGGDVESARLVANGGENLVQDGGFETDAVDWTAGSNNTVARSLVQAKVGTYSLRVERTGSGGNLAASYDRHMKVNPEDCYLFEAWSISGGTTASALVKWEIKGYDAGGTLLGSVVLEATLVANAWQRVAGGFFPAEIDANVEYLTLTYSTTGHTFAVAAGAYLDEITLRSVPFISANALAIGDRENENLLVHRNVLFARDGSLPAPLEVNLYHEEDYWEQEIAGRGLYVLNRPVPPIFEMDVGGGTVAGTALALDDRAAGWKWHVINYEGTLDLNGRFSTSVAPFANAIVGVWITEVEHSTAGVQGFTYTWRPSTVSAVELEATLNGAAQVSADFAVSILILGH